MTVEATIMPMYNGENLRPRIHNSINSTGNTLIISGPSGCGKTYLVKDLIESYPGLFCKLNQFTTRPRRTPDENDYFYVSNEEYDVLKDKLVGCMTFNNYSYGSIFVNHIDKINLLILNFNGLNDFLKKYKLRQINTNFTIINLDTVLYKNKRDGRSEELWQKERFSYYINNSDYKEQCKLLMEFGYKKFDVTNDYITKEEIIKYLKECEML